MEANKKNEKDVRNRKRTLANHRSYRICYRHCDSRLLRIKEVTVGFKDIGSKKRPDSFRLNGTNILAKRFRNVEILVVNLHNKLDEVGLLLIIY